MLTETERHVKATPFSARILATLKSPGGDNGSNLEIVGDALRCMETGEHFSFIKGVPSLYAPPEGQSIVIRGQS